MHLIWNHLYSNSKYNQYAATHARCPVEIVSLIFNDCRENSHHKYVQLLIHTFFSRWKVDKLDLKVDGKQWTFYLHPTSTDFYKTTQSRTQLEDTTDNIFDSETEDSEFKYVTNSKTVRKTKDTIDYTKDNIDVHDKPAGSATWRPLIDVILGRNK